MEKEHGEEVEFPYWHSKWRIDPPTFGISWVKTMMWLFLLSDALTFAGMLGGYAVMRLASGNWPNALHIFEHMPFTHFKAPLFFVGVMTFILICSSGFMVLAVAAAQQKDRALTIKWLMITAVTGAIFLGCQAIEWVNLIHEGANLVHNPWGAANWGACFFIITGFHGLHVTIGVLYLFGIALKTKRNTSSHEGVEICGLYWHFVDLVWVFIFTFLYLL